MDETKPYIWIEPTRPPADSSREFGDTAAIHLVVPNVSRVDVPMTRTERNAVAFDILAKNSRTVSMCKSNLLDSVILIANVTTKVSGRISVPVDRVLKLRLPPSQLERE